MPAPVQFARPPLSDWFKIFWPQLAATALFIVLGIVFIPRAGLQNDEAIFANPLYINPVPDLPDSVLQRGIPLMVDGLSYLGSLKTLLYWPIFSLWGADVWTLRLPALAIASLSIFIFYDLLASMVSRAAAIFGSFLLATTPVYLLTVTFDWGPVAIEHTLLVAGLWAMCRFGAAYLSQNGQNGPFRNPNRYLALGAFCFGLALWNKATFSWILIGMAVGAVIVFPRELWQVIRPNRAGMQRCLLAAAFFLLGAAPLVKYNVENGFQTFGNAHLAIENMEGKWLQAERTANGDALYYYLVAEDWFPNPQPPRGTAGQISAAVVENVISLRHTGFLYVLGGLLLAAPLWWRSRAAWFALVVCATGWVLMALTEGAGGAAHHVITLWPFPAIFAAVALTSPAWGRIRRPVMWTTAVLLVAINLLVLNQYLYQFARFGTGYVFTDALSPLVQHVDQWLETPTGGKVHVLDWGMRNSLQLLHRGKLPLSFVGDWLAGSEPSGEPLRRAIEEILADRGRGLWITHVPEQLITPEAMTNLDRILEQNGLARQTTAIIPDSNGRPIFEVFQLVTRD